MSNEDWNELDESYRSALSGALETAHPAVEQAGGDERDFQAEGAQEVPSPVSQEYDRHLISLLRKGEALPGHQEEAADEIERLRDWNDHLNNTVLPNILNPNFLMLMKGGERLLDLCTKDGKFIGVSLNDMKDVFDWMVTHARIAPDHAALAQPSPKCATCNDSGQIVVSGPHYQGEFQPPEYETEPCDMCAQPSPAQAEQAEAERPEVDPHIPAQTIAEAAIEQLIKSGAEHYEEFHFDVHIDGHEGERPVVVTVAFSDGPSAHELRMKAEQQRDSALAEVERLTRDRDDCLKARLHYATQLGEALARVAELENQDPVAHLRASDLERLNQPGIAGSAGSLWNGPREGFVPLYAAPVARAQHSVPEGWMRVPIEPLLNMMSDKDHDTRIMAERQLLAMLAAAPGKEGL
ncbi:hypothetical protein [Pseudomonas aeruginosa]|uniref:hypothetical protein n=1 Tax=Pseudomonas aeruginosa TaxID=287 RepID=UPI001912AA96|nr:hypothetical protein [Pseudomonas aeruginosa]